MVSERRLAAHVQKVHNPAKIKQALALANRNSVDAAREVFLSTLVHCTSCEKQIQLRNIKRHFAEVHSTQATAEMLALVGLSQPQNLFKSEREREAYWREAAGIQSVEGEDLFDRTHVLSGGAFGLGKSRKN